MASLKSDPRPLVTHCPNSGRLWEFLIPGTPLLLTPAPPGRKTSWTTAAFFYKGNWIPIYSAKANQITGQLLLEAYHPGRSFSREVTIEGTGHRSRFDFGSFDAGEPDILIEVKACTLEHRGVAMFPDAPSERALRHIQGLDGAKGFAQVIFAILCPQAQGFLPHPHCDPHFTKTLLGMKDKLGFKTPVFETQIDGSIQRIREVPILWDWLEGFDWESGVFPLFWENGTETLVGWIKDYASFVKGIRNPPKGFKTRSLPIFGRQELTPWWQEAWDQTFPEAFKVSEVQARSFFPEPTLLPPGTWYRFPGLLSQQERFWDLVLDFRHLRCFKKATPGGLQTLSRSQP